MGEFLAVTAFRTRDAEALSTAVARYFSDHGHPAQRVKPADPQHLPGDDAVIRDPVENWTVVTWPRYMQDGPAAEAITAALSTTASSIRVYDGDYWVHRLVERGQTLDRFASMPDYFAEYPDSEETTRLAAEWAGQPEILAAALGVTAADIAPYFVQAPPLEDGDDSDEPHEDWGKAFPDDEHDRSDIWVFTDFWRRMAIRYPQPNPSGDATALTRVLRLPPGAALNLPIGTDQL